MKRRVLFITRNFPPLTGGMERLNFHAFEALAARYDMALIGPEGCEPYVREVAASGISTASSLRHVMRCCARALRLARQWRPDLVVAGSGVTAPPARIAARCAGANSITLVHGLDLIYPSALYRIGFLPAIRNSDLVIANSNNTARLARAAGVKGERIEILHPGVSLPGDLSAVQPPRLDFDPGDRKILLAVGRLIRRKGIPAFIRHSLPRIVKERPGVMFLVAGGASESTPLKGQGVEAEIGRAVEEAGMGAHVRLLGRVTDEALRQLWSIADLHLFPVLDLPGDVEGFGMVAVEAAAHGVPTIAFAAGGVGDAVEDGVTGYLVEQRDYPAFARAVLRGLEAPGEDLRPRDCIDYAARFSWDNYGRRLQAICERLLS